MLVPPTLANSDNRLSPPPHGGQGPLDLPRYEDARTLKTTVVLPGQGLLAGLITRISLPRFSYQMSGRGEGGGRNVFKPRLAHNDTSYQLLCVKRSVILYWP